MFLDNLTRILGLSVPAKKRLYLAQRETEKIAIAEEELERQRIIDLHNRYRSTGGEVNPQDLTQFSVEETIDLGKARSNVVIWNRPFKSITITENLPGGTAISPHNWGAMPPKAYIRFNTIASPLYRVRPGNVRGIFDKIYLTNIAQSGYSFSFVISNDEQASFDMRADNWAILEGMSLLQGITTKKTLGEIWSELRTITQKAQSTPTTFNVTIVNPDTEYSQAIPVNTKSLKAVLADGAIFRTAWVTGKVAAPTAPYYTNPVNVPYEVSGLDFQVAKTLYFADPVGTKVAQIECFV